MWIFQAPSTVLALVAIIFSSSVSAKPYPVHIEELRQLHNASQLERRDCPSGTPCGWSGQICCASNEYCYTDSNNQAQCGQGAAPTSGWVYYTTTWVETGFTTRTSVYSSYVGGTAQAVPTSTCTGAQSPCGGMCCDMGYYCQYSGQCALIGGASGGASGGVPSAPLRPTSSTLVVITATGSPTTTVPFQTPIATGANATLTEGQPSGGGLSGGAIAGIVIGVIAGILLLILLCLYCCAKAAFDGFLALVGMGKKNRKHTHEETYIEEHHHSSAAGSGRRWHGSRPPPPPKKKSGLGGMLGVGAALGGLALALGMKRRHDRHDDEKTTISDTTYGTYTSYYTSTSSASSDDRRTRNTRPSRNSSRR
ncbi:hypothetical protein GQ43DRAFT_421066 [Delitschia confertaspora ATCC 74209]|uniref:Uncharacterized protein n=1 Tax=Delitschia confertaspora ATCC 74209 TaxID=1513339 RepID=A0A9P4MWL1_9PLEO|nr:hypothetical protein GQ43DRAFT_421066 [Delitschia confertaspora ATCC 74209]